MYYVLSGIKAWAIQELERKGANTKYREALADLTVALNNVLRFH